MLNATFAVKQLRQILQDYNYWPESESNSPLKVTRSKTMLSREDILSRDAEMRKAITANTGYKIPERTIAWKTLDETFKPLVARYMLKLVTANEAMESGSCELEVLGIIIEPLEFLIQIHSVFKELSSVKTAYVLDGKKGRDEGECYTGLFLIGNTDDSEVIVASTLLTQT